MNNIKCNIGCMLADQIHCALYHNVQTLFGMSKQ